MNLTLWERFRPSDRFRATGRLAARLGCAYWAATAAYERAVGTERAHKPLAILAIGVGAFVICASLSEGPLRWEINNEEWAPDTWVGHLLNRHLIAGVGAVFIYSGAKSF